MKAIGIRELKAHLSRVLREVEGGEVVLVTDRGRVMAELRTPGSAVDDSAASQALRRLAAGGGLRVGEPPPRGPYRASPVRAAPGTARTLLDQERGER